MDYKLQKVGIQLLSQNGLTNIFPNYDELLENIAACRRRIKEADTARHYQYNLLYDNVFSIIGKRGTGKTSAIFSLKKMIEEQKDRPYDLTIPIIMPDVISERNGILDWILAVFEDEIEKIENKLTAKDEPSFDYGCRYRADNAGQELRKKYEHLLEWNFSDKYFAKNAGSFYEAVGNSTKQVRNSYRLIREISEFWDMLVHGIRLMQPAEKQDIHPLIYFFFDDVDLAPGKVEELLTTVRSYLAHPNIIVIMTADEDVFLEVLENNIDKSMGRPQKNIRQFLSAHVRTTEYEPDFEMYTYKDFVRNEERRALNDMARMYLGKVMPPSSRYYLKIFENPEDKKDFICEMGQDSYTLMQFLDYKINRLLGKKKKADGRGSFLYYRNSENIFYLDFIGETARQIANGIWIINDLIENLLKVQKIKADRRLSHIYCHIYHFLHTSIVANHKISGMIDDIEEFLNEFFKKDYNGWSLHIKYDYINLYIEQCLENDKNENGAWEAGRKLYALAFFTENIILMLESNEKYYKGFRKKIHGMQSFIDFIYSSGLSENLLRRTMPTDMFLSHYGNMLMKIPDLRDTRDFGKFTKKYLYSFSKCKGESVIDIDIKEVFSWYLQDKDWLMKISGMLFMFYENIYRLDKTEIVNSLLIWNDNFYLRYESNLIGIQLHNLDEFILAFDDASQNDNDQWMESLNMLQDNEIEELYIKKQDYELHFSNDYVTLSELLRRIELEDKREETGSGLEQIKKWAFDLHCTGIIKNIDELNGKVKKEEGWLEILSETRFLIGNMKNQIVYLAVMDVDEVSECMDNLKEYRDYRYAEEIESAKKNLEASTGNQLTVLPREAAQAFMTLIQELYKAS